MGDIMESIIIRNQENLKGIFYYSDVEYQIIAETGSGNISQLSHYEEAKTYWYSSSNKPQVLIKFASFVLITNYSIIKKSGNTFPASFVLYGKQNGRFVVIDKQEDQLFDGDITHTKYNLSVTYQTSKSILTKEVLLKQTKNSDTKKEYLLLRGLEFYGIVCNNCIMLRMTHKKKHMTYSYSISIYLLLPS